MGAAIANGIGAAKIGTRAARMIGADLREPV
jgi:hypothetical protein